MIGRRAHPFGRGLCPHTRGPNDCFGLEAPIPVDDTVCRAFCDSIPEYDFDAKALERPLRIG